MARLPARIDTYYEPFVGGGALFFALAAQRRFRRAVLGDANEDLLEVYRAVQRDVEAVIRELKHFRHAEEEYYRIRSLDSAKLSLAGRAARLIYLNKTGYNGLYRVNRSGQFNVPFGRHKNPTICDAENLRAAARVLKRIRLVRWDFERTCALAGQSDAVYLDPPYLPVSKTANFTAYDRHRFGLPEHRRLADVFSRLASRGVHAVLSNSDTPETRRLYEGLSVETVPASRLINSKADARGTVNELLVTSKLVAQLSYEEAVAHSAKKRRSQSSRSERSTALPVE